MDIFDVLQMIGGLCLLLVGMEPMGDGLTGTSGSKLQGILGSLTSSVPKGVVLGCLEETGCYGIYTDSASGEVIGCPFCKVGNCSFGAGIAGNSC